MLPPFTDRGVLPPGDHALTLPELRGSFLVRGPTPARRNWDSGWRGKLVDNLEILAGQLWSIGITDIFVDGSFVEDRDRPNDIDGYFGCSVRDVVDRVLERKLNAIDPFRAWGWGPGSRSPGGKTRLWTHYRVDLWPYYTGTMFGFDASNDPLDLYYAFRRTKHGQIPKGIIRLAP